jgi:hypothetical protein
MAYFERSNTINAANQVINPATNEALTQGEIVEVLEALRMAVVSLTKSVGSAYPDTSGRLRVALDSITAALTLATITTVGTVTTVSALTNQASAGSYAMNDQVPALMKISAESLRRNISVS